MPGGDNRGWPAGLAGMLVLVIVLEACVAWRESSLMTMSTLIWNANGGAAGVRPRGPRSSASVTASS